MNEELKKALFTLLYDQYDISDMELDDSEESYIGYIINALIEKNENKCPFKCYDCIGKCSDNRIGCVDGLVFSCDRKIEEVWREFINI